MPIITAVDRLVGATNAMRIDATNAAGTTVTLRMTHRDLEVHTEVPLESMMDVDLG